MSKESVEKILDYARKDLALMLYYAGASSLKDFYEKDFDKKCVKYQGVVKHLKYIEDLEKTLIGK